MWKQSITSKVGARLQVMLILWRKQCKNYSTKSEKKQVGITYNKGGYQYITEIDLKNFRVDKIGQSNRKN